MVVWCTATADLWGHYHMPDGRVLWRTLDNDGHGRELLCSQVKVN